MSVEVGQSEYQHRSFDDGGADEEKRRGHSKNSSYNDRDRKIGHRRINEDGLVSYKKIETNTLMGSIQLGIQAAIGGLTKYADRDLLMQDFMTVETTQFPKQGSKQTPAHSYADFTFRTYAPVAFRYFRDLFGIPPDDFMMSICNEAMRELSNPGASGSIFYLTNDDEFILKTVSMKEAEFLQKLLPGYYMNLQQNPRTTLPKFFGMFCYQCNQKNIRLVVMNNLLPSSIKLHLKFDLKGSTYKRKAGKHEVDKKSPTFKDLDFLQLLPDGLMLEPETYTAMINTMKRDCRVLESFKIMDYSLLVGVHNLDMAAKEREESSGAAGSSEPVAAPAKRDKLVAHSTAMESIQCTSDPVDIPSELPSGGIPARNHKGERLLLFVGVIDILQSYRLVKKIEHTFKAMIHDGDTVSVHRPGFYAERFLNFMSEKIFKKIPSSLKHSPSKRIKPVKRTPGATVTGAAQDRSLPPNKEGPLPAPPDVVPGGEVVSISDVRLEGVTGPGPRQWSHNSLGTPSRLGPGGRTPTPTWTEGTPSFTESTYSGDTAFPTFPTTPSRSQTDGPEEPRETRVFQETEM